MSEFAGAHDETPVMIEKSPSDNYWGQAFKKESDLLTSNVPSILGTFHIGPNALGVFEKKQIDILVVSDCPPIDIKESLAKLGYSARSLSTEDELLFARHDQQFTINLYIYETNDQKIESTLIVRDFLKANIDYLEDYKKAIDNASEEDFIEKVKPSAKKWHEFRQSIVKSDRVSLQNWLPRDWINFFGLASSRKIVGYIRDGYPYSRIEARDFVTKEIENIQKYGYGFFKLQVNGESRISGICGIRPLGSSTKVEMGIWLLPELHGKGYAQEAIELAVDYIRQNYEISYIDAYCHPENRNSIKVMTRVGFTFVRECLTDDLGMTPLGKPISLFRIKVK